jgi:hypothetical protein
MHDQQNVLECSSQAMFSLLLNPPVSSSHEQSEASPSLYLPFLSIAPLIHVALAKCLITFNCYFASALILSPFGAFIGYFCSFL